MIANEYIWGAAFILAGFILAGPVNRMIVNVLAKLFAKTKTELDDKLLETSQKPIRFMVRSVFILVGLRIIVSALPLEPGMIKGTQDTLKHLINTMIIISGTWLVNNSFMHFDLLAEEIKVLFGIHMHRVMIPLISKILSVLVWAFALIMIFSEWGFNASGFVAGLGISGLAIAIALQDLLSNIFGGFAILMDKPFDIGDWIVVGETEGVVETISLRSTKIRQFDRGVVSVPNLKLATNHVRNYSRREERRIAFQLGIEYGTPVDTIEELLADLRQLLVDHPRIKNDLMIVNLEHFADSAMEIKMYFFADTSDWLEFLKVQEDVKLKILRLLEEKKVNIAFPSVQVYRKEEKEIGTKVI